MAEDAAPVRVRIKWQAGQTGNVLLQFPGGQLLVTAETARALAAALLSVADTLDEPTD